MHCTNTARALHYSPGQPCFVTQKWGYESTMSTPAGASCSWGYVYRHNCFCTAVQPTVQHSKFEVQPVHWAEPSTLMYSTCTAQQTDVQHMWATAARAWEACLDGQHTNTTALRHESAHHNRHICSPANLTVDNWTANKQPRFALKQQPRCQHPP